MKSGKKLTALILAAAMVVSNMNTTMIGAATAKATAKAEEESSGGGKYTYGNPLNVLSVVAEISYDSIMKRNCVQSN